MKRKDVDDKYKWDLTYLYPSFDEWNKDAKRLPKMIEKIEKYRGHLLDSPKMLLEYYKYSESVEEIIEKMHFYTFLLIDVDMDNVDTKKYFEMISGIIAEYNAKTSFVVPELLQSDYSVIEEFMNKNEGLRIYETMFKEMFRIKEHMLSSEEEAIISEYQSVCDNYGKSSQYIRNKEMDYGEITLSDGSKVNLTASTLSKYSQSEDRDVRRQAYELSSKAYLHSINSLATNYIGYIKSFEIESKYRKYSSYLEQKLFERDINLNVYETLKRVVLRSHNSYSRYVKLYKDVLKYDDFKVYDMAAPLVKGSNKEFSVEKAKEMLLDTFSIYGDYYTDVLKFAFDKKCIDFIPSESKVTGWYSAYIPYAHPIVFANYDNKILDVSSLAHELGHFVNQYMIIKNQPPMYVYQTSFCAEVASLNNEIVFSNLYRKKEKDNDVKKELLANYIKVFASNFFGAARQAIFEEKAHTYAKDNMPLSSDVLSELWMDVTKDVYGDELKGYDPNGWACIPHYFMGGGYYTFNYSTAIIAASNLAYKILNEETGILDKYKKFLTIGSSMNPIDSLKVLGIDMANEETYDIALKMFNAAIDEFYQLIG